MSGFMRFVWLLWESAGSAVSGAVETKYMSSISVQQLEQNRPLPWSIIRATELPSTAAVRGGIPSPSFYGWIVKEKKEPRNHTTQVHRPMEELLVCPVPLH